MRRDRKFTEIITIAIVAVLAVVIIIGSRLLENYDEKNPSGNEASGGDEAPVIDGEEIDISSYDNPDGIIKSAYTIDEGYVVRVAPQGFIGPINMDIYFDSTGDTITSLVVNSHKESEGYGAVIGEENFQAQFEGIDAPIYLEGNAPEGDSQDNNSGEDVANLVDGIYTAEGETSGDYKGIVTIVVEGGKVTSVVYDAMDNKGEYKSYLSSVGEYTMVEGNPTWKEQADALAAYVIENQSTSGLTMNEEGKTDAVSGVSISINEFVNLVETALKDAATGENASLPETSETPSDGTGTQVDAISGATSTTNGVLAGVNGAHTFLKDFVIQ